MNINVTFQIGADTQRFLKEWLGFPKLLTKILTIVEEIKIMNEETTRLLGEIDAATTELAADIQALIDRAEEAGSVTAAEINAALAPKVEFLKQLAADTNAPVPEVPAPTA